MFNAIVIDKDDAGYRAALTTLEEEQLPPGDVLVRVEYSTLNYKDGLAITVRRAGGAPLPDGTWNRFSRYVRTQSPCRFSRRRSGCAEWLGRWRKALGRAGAKARVNGDWLIPLPAGLDAHSAMGGGR